MVKNVVVDYLEEYLSGNEMLIPGDLNSISDGSTVIFPSVKICKQADTLFELAEKEIRESDIKKAIIHLRSSAKLYAKVGHDDLSEQLYKRASIIDAYGISGKELF